MTAQRKLNEDEINEQIRISAKEELREYFQGGSPRTKKIDDAHEALKILTAEMQLRQSAKNSAIKILNMLSPKERLNEINKLKRHMLPEA